MTLSPSTDAIGPILVTGVFDMANFGDLLFPLIADFRLSPFGFEVKAASPNPSSPPLPGAAATISLTEMLAGHAPIRGLLLGGGYIIHNHKMHFLKEYQDRDIADWAGPGIWLGATLAAAVRDVPLAWNAPGVPHPFAANHRPIIDAALAAADYLSVRDRGGVELLAPSPESRVHVVPDSVADLARMWPRRMLADPFGDFLDRKGGDPGARYAVFHFRNRSVAAIGVAGAAAAVDAFASQASLYPVLMAVGQSHADDDLARAISTEMQTPHLLLDDPQSLIELAAVIANAALYVGASLHGYIAAAAYGVPGVLVAQPAYRKFAGFLEHTGRLQDLTHDWFTALQLANEHLAEPTRCRIPASVIAALDVHWDRVSSALSDPTRCRSQRLRFLRCYFQSGIAAAGPRWAHEPFLRRGARAPAFAGTRGENG